MARYRHIQNSLIGGELSPKAFGRTDLNIYPQSLETCKNIIPHAQGGGSSRVGTQLIKSLLAKNNLENGNQISGFTPVAITSGARIFKFSFSRTENYAFIIEADGDGGGTTTIGIVNADTLIQTDIDYLTPSVGRPRFDGYDSDAEVDEVQVAQSGDLLFFTHPNHQPYFIARTGTNSFERREFYNAPDIDGVRPIAQMFPFLPVNLNNAHTMTISGGTGQVLTSSIAFFTADHVGAVIKLTIAGVTSNFVISGFTSSTVVTGNEPNSAGAATADWEESAFSPERGYPRAISFHEQRLDYAGTSFQPDTVFASQIGDIFEMDARAFAQDARFGTVANSDPFSFTVASTEVNEIQWLSSGRNLNIGTLGREYIATGSQGALGPLDIVVTPETSFGSVLRQPVRLENTVNFINRAQHKIRQFIFNRDEDSFRANDLLLFAEHMPRLFLSERASAAEPEINRLAMQESDETILWAVNTNGALFGVTIDRQTGVQAWHEHEFGGLLNTEPAFVRSMVAIPSGDGAHDDLWLAIERTIDGGDVTYIERMNRQFNGDTTEVTTGDILDYPVYVDSAKLVSQALSTTVNGYQHLANETVQVLADGFYVGEFVVSAGGAITLNKAAEEIVAGFQFNADVKTLKIEAGSVIGSSQITIGRIDEIGIRFFRTVSALFGPDEDNLQRILFRKASLNMGDVIPLFTGDKNIKFDGTYTRAVQAFIRQDRPFPMTVSAFILKGITYD